MHLFYDNLETHQNMKFYSYFALFMCISLDVLVSYLTFIQNVSLTHSNLYREMSKIQEKLHI
jgi:hypothetical protein